MDLQLGDGVQIGGSVRAGRRPALITARSLLLSAACERIADSA
jgi:hypothetical protein